MKNEVEDKLEELIDYIEKVQHSHLKKAISQAETDLLLAEKPSAEDKRELKSLEAAFHELKCETSEIIKLEERMIFPHIRLLLKFQSAKTLKRDFQNLSRPVKNLVMMHHRLLDKIKTLMQGVSLAVNKGYYEKDYRKALSELFSFYADYEKLVYLEESVLFPRLHTLYEKNAELN